MLPLRDRMSASSAPKIGEQQEALERPCTAANAKPDEHDRGPATEALEQAEVGAANVGSSMIGASTMTTSAFAANGAAREASHCSGTSPCSVPGSKNGVHGRREREHGDEGGAAEPERCAYDSGLCSANASRFGTLARSGA